MNLLIVNDEILTAETMKTDIDWKEYGINQIFTAYDTEMGKACIQEQHIDIMLCDIEMPGENGIALLRWVRENRKEVECIFLTCHASFEYAREALQLGCQNYLLIPARYEDIGKEIYKAVKRIREKQEAVRYQEYGKQAVLKKIDQAAESQGKKKSAEELVKETVSYINQNIGSESLSVNEIAEKLYIHPVYLNRIFKKKEGISVGKYIIQERMKLAGEMLKSGRINANVVAEEVGYSSYPNFHLMFKKYYNCTPAQYFDKCDQSPEIQKA